MECGKSFLYIRKKTLSSYLFAFVPSRCKSWSCPKCRPIKANIVRDYVKRNFTGDDLYMLTLTFYHTGNVLDAWKNLGSCWNRMRTYVTKFRGKFNYIRIVEPHAKGGWPHLHILIDGCVIDSGIMKMVTKWGFGWNTQLMRISGKNASVYLSKYLTKEWPAGSADINRLATKTRIVSVNRGMPAIFTCKSEWSCVQHSIPSDHALFYCNAIIRLLKERGCTYALSSPFSDGFIIQSDIAISDGLLERLSEPYIWKVCEGFEYEYIPYGLQQVMPLIP